MTRPVLLTFLLLLLDSAVAGPKFAAELKSQVRLIEAGPDNTKLQATVSAGDVLIALHFHLAPEQAGQAVDLVMGDLGSPQTPQNPPVPGQLVVTGAAPSPPPNAKLRAGPLVPPWLMVDLKLGGLRPKSNYTGRLYMLADNGDQQAWEISLNTGTLGILAIDKLPPIKIVTFPWIGPGFEWFETKLGSMIEGIGRKLGWTCIGPINWSPTKASREFPVTVRDRSSQGPYRNLRVRVEDPHQASTDSLTSAFTSNALSFWTASAATPGARPVNLNATCGARAGQSAVCEIAHGDQTTLVARVESLSAGEYTPVLRFIADGASDDAPESSVSLILLVRHHWMFPLLCILAGSTVGWLGQRYTAAYWSRWNLRQRLATLQGRTASLAKADQQGRVRLPNEAYSYGLASARVMLHRVGDRVKLVREVISSGNDIEKQLADAERRINALERVQETRRKLQPVAIGPPSAYQAIYRGLSAAQRVLDRTIFSESDEAELKPILTALEAWLNDDVGKGPYGEAVYTRVRNLLATTTPDGFGSDKTKARARVSELRAALGQFLQEAPPGIDKVRDADQLAARLDLLWRDRRQLWLDELVSKEAAEEPIETLRYLSNLHVWQILKEENNRGQLKVDVSGTPDSLRPYDLFEMRLQLLAGLPEYYLVEHPFLVKWSLISMNASASVPPKPTTTDSLTMVQYLPESGAFEATAELDWEAEKIPVGDKPKLTVKASDTREQYHWAIEILVTAIALSFAVLTGLSVTYNASFGSFAQYVSLFLWAAGVNASGNFFRARGTGQTVGGGDLGAPAGR